MTESDLPLITAAITTIGGGVAWVISTLRRNASADETHRFKLWSQPLRDEIERSHSEIVALHIRVEQCQSELARWQAPKPPTS